MRSFFFIFVALILCAGSARAAESLNFRSSTNDIRALSFLDILQQGYNFDPSSPYEIASIDLNGDGVDEWILRQASQGCESRASCRFFVGAIKQRNPVVLDQIYAGKIRILEQKLYGVSGLAVYNDPDNDFDYKTYLWDPVRSTYSPL